MSEQRLPFPPGLQAFMEGRLPPGPPPEPRPAATVALVRDGPAGLETYLVRRARGMKFLGGAHVFPGGRVDARDGGPEAAAVREVREEVGVDLREEDLRRWSRWITPEVETRRFDALFFVAALPEGQQARAVEGELVDGVWLRPQQAVERAAAGSMILAPPTLWTLLELAQFSDVAALLRADRRCETFRPWPHVDAAGRLLLLLEGDEAYGDFSREVEPARQRRLIFDGRRWQVVGGPGGG